MPVAEDLRHSYEELLSSVEGLTARELERPNTIGKWSIRDVLLHIAMWDGEVLKALAVWRTGHAVDWSYVKDIHGIRKLNDFWIGSMKHLSVKKVLQMLKANHATIEADVLSDYKRRLRTEKERSEMGTADYGRSLQGAYAKA